ncbi:hypothetical protein [Dyella flagellata]|nr:hypothetical protein [Dyella flagellata]
MGIVEELFAQGDALGEQYLRIRLPPGLMTDNNCAHDQTAEQGD